MRTEYTRRRVVQAGLGCLPLAIAGCGGTGSETTDGLAGSESFVETDIDGSALVVQLRDETDLTRVTLTGPGGEEFESASVAAGATSVRLPLFDIRSGRHYTPGEHTLVGVADGAERTSVSLDLRPELEITDVEPYTGGDKVPRNRGNLLVTVENVGTGPTWVYYVSYENAPNDVANNSPSEEETRYEPDVYLSVIGADEGRILTPSDSKQYLGRHPPFLVSSDRPCDGETVDLDVITKAGVGENTRKSLTATLEGGQFENRFSQTCEEITVEPSQSE